MTATLKIKNLSVHDATSIDWVALPNGWAACVDLPSSSGKSAYEVRLFAGDKRYSSPEYKLVTWKNYGAYELHVLRNGIPTDVRSLLLSVATLQEIEQLCLIPGFVNPYCHHRDVYKILAMVKYIASLE